MAETNVGAPLRVGSTRGKYNAKGLAGGLTSPIYVVESTPAQLLSNGIAASQAVAGAGNLTLNGSLATAGVATLDIPRSITITSSSATDVTQVATFTGTGLYGSPVVEAVTLNGGTALGAKAFKTVTRVALSGSTTGNITAGSGDKFGLPYRINAKGSLQAFWDATWNSGSGTTTVSVNTTATATSGDVRGTYLPATASDGTRTMALWIYLEDVDTANGLYGVDQYGG